MDSKEREEFLINKLKKSLEKELKGIENLGLDLMTGVLSGERSVRWEGGGFRGHIHLIGETSNGTILLDFEKNLTPSRGSDYSKEAMREALKVHDEIEKYLKKYGEEHTSMYPSRIGFYFKNGIPN